LGDDGASAALLEVVADRIGIIGLVGDEGAPRVILSLIKTSWDDRLSGFFGRAEKARDDGTSDVLLLLAGLSEMVEREGAIPVIEATTTEKLDVLRMALDDGSVPGRALVINLSARLRRFHRALSEIHPQPEDHALDKRRERAKGQIKKARAKSRTRRMRRSR
jgi:hypothetical protein